MLATRTTLLLLAALLAAPPAARAQLKAAVGDWPAWMGPGRTGVSSEKDLVKEWPKDGPPLLWKATGVGEGYSTPSVAGGRIYLMSNRGLDDEFALALDLKTGKKIWSMRVGKVGKNTFPKAQYPGARSTPTVDGDAVYVLGSDGDLACLGADKGEMRWKRNIKDDFAGAPGAWAYAESPLIDGDTLVCTPGGAKATLVALNKKNGELIWQAPVPAAAAGPGQFAANTAAYASPIVAEVGGVRHYVQFLHGGLVGVAAKDGKLLWRYDGVTGITNCTTPLFHDDCVLVSATGRGRTPTTGTALVRLSADNKGGVSAKEVYHVQDLANHHGGVVLVGGYVYGTSNTGLVCMDFQTGETKWQARSVGKGSILAAGGRLYVRSEEGPIALVEATPSGYKEISRFEQPDRSSKKAWPHPVVAGGRLYLRDQDVLLCYDVKEK